MIPGFPPVFLFFAVTQIPISESSIHPIVVVGSVLCDITTNCLPQHHGLPQSTQFISGATVSIHCEDLASGGGSFSRKTRTDDRGRFKLCLPGDVAKVVLKRDDAGVCSVKLVRSGDPKCNVPSLGSSSTLRRLKSTRHGFRHRFSAGVLSFKPTTSLCDQKRMKNQFFPPPIFPPPPLILPIPGLAPPPPLIPLPPIPGLTPPPPPIIPLPPIPWFTPPPPAPIIPLPPIPWFTPPPPPPPTFPFPFPPIAPFPPIPGFTHPPPPPPPPPPAFLFPPLPFLPPPIPPGSPPAPITA